MKQIRFFAFSLSALAALFVSSFSYASLTAWRRSRPRKRIPNNSTEIGARWNMAEAVDTPAEDFTVVADTSVVITEAVGTSVAPWQVVGGGYHGGYHGGGHPVGVHPVGGYPGVRPGIPRPGRIEPGPVLRRLSQPVV